MTTSEEQPVTYTFDTVAVATFRVTTRAGEAAARKAMSVLDSTDLYDGNYGTDLRGYIAGDIRYEVTCVSPRGEASLIHAYGNSGRGAEVTVTEDAGFSEPLPGDYRAALTALVTKARKALRDDSNDAGYEALTGMTDAIARLLGLPEDVVITRP